MPEKKNLKLILRIETEDRKAVEIVIEGADNIAYILDEAGLLYEELKKILGY